MQRIAILLAAGLAGCYHPSIKDGTIYCSDDPTPKCPSGLKCAANGLCYSKLPILSSTAYGDGRLGSQDLTGMSGTLVLHTNTGEITLHDDTANTDSTIEPAAAGPYGTPQTGGPPVALWSFTSLTIPAGMPVQTSPDSRAVPVLAATVSLTMKGAIDLAGSGGQNGGANGSGVNPYGMGSSDGVGGGGAMASTSGGGGGGGHIAAGAAGLGSGGGAAGPDYGTAVLPVFFGAGGGGGGANGGSLAGFGGTGGGAIVLLGASVDIEGSIDVSGADGWAGTAGDAGGGGGGSGGSILISGDTVTIGASAVLTARGGAGGAAAGSGGKGGDGADGVVQLDGTVNNGGMSVPMATTAATALPAFPQ